MRSPSCGPKQDERSGKSAQRDQDRSRRRRGEEGERAHVLDLLVVSQQLGILLSLLRFASSKMVLQLLGNLSTESLDVGELVSKFVDFGDEFVVLLFSFLEDLATRG